MTPAKRTRTLGSSSKLLSDCNHSFPAIIATDAHNNLIVATENFNPVRSWRRLSFSVISQRILALPGDVTADDENPVFVDLIIDIPAADSEMLHNKRNKYFYCVVFTTYALPATVAKNSNREIRRMSPYINTVLTLLHYSEQNKHLISHTPVDKQHVSAGNYIPECHAHFSEWSFVSRVSSSVDGWCRCHVSANERDC